MRAVAFFVLTFALPALLRVDVSAQTNAPAQPQAELIKINLMVTDSSDRIVETVRLEDLRVVEGNKQLPVSFVAKDERRLIYVICLDVSGSLKSQELVGPTVARALIKNKQPEDEIAITGFSSSDNIHTLSNFTTNQTELLESLRDVQTQWGQSAVIDGIYLSTQLVAEHRPDDYSVRRAVIIVSDGEDRLSYYSKDQLMKLVRDSEVQLFIIGLVKQLDTTSSGRLDGFSQRERAENLLKKLADESGGRVFFPRNKESLLEATAQTFRSLNLQQVIGFERQSKPGEKGFRKFKVSLIRAPNSPKLKVITKVRFWVGPKEPKKVKKG